MWGKGCEEKIQFSLLCLLVSATILAFPVTTSSDNHEPKSHRHLRLLMRYNQQIFGLLACSLAIALRLYLYLPVDNEIVAKSY